MTRPRAPQLSSLPQAEERGAKYWPFWLRGQGRKNEFSFIFLGGAISSATFPYKKVHLLLLTD